MLRFLLLLACFLTLSYASQSCKCSDARPASKQCPDGSLSVASCAYTGTTCSWAYSKCPTVTVCNQACIQPPVCQSGDPVATKAPGSCCPTYTCPSAPAPQVCTKACVRPPTCQYGEPIATGTCCPTYTCPPAPPTQVCTKACMRPPTCQYGEPIATGTCCPTYTCPSAPSSCPGEGDSCGGFTGQPCSNGNQCIDNPNDSCDPKNGGADCPGICTCTPQPKCPGEGDFCGGISGRPCSNGNQCIDNPNDSCDPMNGGADCGGICSCTPEPQCPGEGESCGGFAGRQCSNGNQCIDDPSDSCDPMNGGADCPGICSCTPQQQQCDAPFVFSECPSTCANCRSVTQHLLCSLVCIPGCTCPEGQVLDEATNTCISPDQCPTDTISCAAIQCQTGSDCIDGVGCVPRTTSTCMTMKCSAGYTCVEGKGCVQNSNDDSCDSVECDVDGQVCEMVNDPTCKGRYCKQVPRCVCPDCPRARCSSGTCLPWETCSVSSSYGNSACSCPKAVCTAKPRPNCKTNYMPRCDKKPKGCVYDQSVKVVDRNGCPMRCPRVLCPSSGKGGY